MHRVGLLYIAPRETPCEMDGSRGPREGAAIGLGV